MGQEVFLYVQRQYTDLYLCCRAGRAVQQALVQVLVADAVPEAGFQLVQHPVQHRVPGIQQIGGVSLPATDAGGSVRARLVTDADGFAEAADLPAPDAAYSLDAANTAVQPYAIYRIEAALDGWQPLVLNGVQVFDAQQTVARLNLLPAGAAPASAVSRTGEVETDIVTIPPHTLFAGNGGSGPAPKELLPGSVLNRIVVPKKITVHLGKPSANVRNVTVSFQSYIANVASSEVYPTWDSAPGTRRTSI